MNTTYNYKNFKKLVHTSFKMHCNIIPQFQNFYFSCYASTYLNLISREWFTKVFRDLCTVIFVENS